MNYSGNLAYECIGCNTRFSGEYETVIQLIRFHELQHSLHPATVDAFLEEAEAKLGRYQ